MLSRRTFIRQLAAGAALAPVPWIFQSCKTAKDQTQTIVSTSALKISLAQWSLHRAFESGNLKPEYFPSIARQTYGMAAVEYVNGFYRAYGEDEKFWNKLKRQAYDNGVKNLLIMIDEEGDLGNPVEEERIKAVENHYKWVNAASVLNCHSVRVNAFGDGDRHAVQAATIDSMGRLCEYAVKLNINVLIENHGLYSSDGKWVAEVMRQVNKPNCGTLPDFGNWCLSAKWGTTQIECAQVYDRYQGVADMLPFAKGVSAKSYSFNDQGEETRIDYKRMLKLVKDSGFDGHIGIEFEGFGMEEHKGIIATQRLIEKAWNEV